MTCPKENWCTSSMKMAKFEKQYIDIEDRGFTAGAMCMYWFKFSVDARQKDVLNVDITSMENVKVYTARGDD